jgi:hypothetical protein
LEDESDGGRLTGKLGVEAILPDEPVRPDDDDENNDENDESDEDDPGGFNADVKEGKKFGLSRSMFFFTSSQKASSYVSD